jgi:hypothetical protein
MQLSDLKLPSVSWEDIEPVDIKTTGANFLQRGGKVGNTDLLAGTVPYRIKTCCFCLQPSWPKCYTISAPEQCGRFLAHITPLLLGVVLSMGWDDASELRSSTCLFFIAQVIEVCLDTILIWLDGAVWSILLCLECSRLVCCPENGHPK